MKRKLAMMLLFAVATISAWAQSAINGTVVSASDGEPVIGATVKVKGASQGTVTDMKGKFTINAQAGKTLVVSYIGMETKEAKAKNGMVVELGSDDTVLDEVMVVAYGKTKRSAFTGSAGEVKAADITNHVASSATSALSGKVAGVSMTTGNGGPGSAPSITIRGIGSINASQSPLYIVDGAPYEAGIQNINPQDIESMSVLKDASAAAIYGARGANGVIIITTKKAKDGDAKVTFDAKFGSNSDLIGRYDVIKDPGQYYETHYKAMFNSKYYHGATAEEAYSFADGNLYNKDNGGLGYQVYTVPQGEKLIGTNFRLNPNAKLGYSDGEFYYTPDDWYDEAIHSSFRQEYNIGVSGSNNRLNYYASAGYLDDGGQVNNSRYQRYTGRTSVDYQVKKWMKISTSMGYTHAISETPSYSTSTWGSSGNVFYISKNIAPIYPLYVRNADGTIKMEQGRKVYDISTNTNQHRAAIVGNAIRDNEYNTKQGFRDVFNGNWGVTLTPVEGLTLNATLSAMANNYRYNALYSTFGSSSSVDGAGDTYHSRVFTVNQLYTANYGKMFGKHNFDVLVGYEQFKIKEQLLEGYNDHLYNPFNGELDNAYGTVNKSVSSYTDHKMNEGFFGRLQYDYDSKYFASVSYRRDASSVLAPGHRWGSFWSVGGAWQMNKENFLADASWVDLLKLKASYGVQGNDGIGYYAYADRYKVSYNEETGAYGTQMSAKGNENITWEKNYALNLGLDFTLFKGRIDGSVEWFNRTTKDMLFYKYVPASSGLTVSGYYDNIGEMYNRGIEFTLTGYIFKSKDFNWSINLNATSYKNKITKLEDELITTGRILKEGGSVYEAYMYKYAGLDQATGQAQYWKHVMYDSEDKVTTDKTKMVREEDVMTKNFDEATQYDCGTTLPDVVGGFGTSLSAYGIDFSAQFTYSLGGKFYDGTYQAYMHNGQSAGETMHKDLLNAWTETNRNTNIPRLSTAAADDGFQAGSQSNLDYFLTSSNYLALSNVTLGYTFPKNLLRKIDLQALRIYVSGENLFLLKKRQGTDPRYNYGIGSMTQGTGLAGGSYSAMRTITAGISLTF